MVKAAGTLWQNPGNTLRRSMGQYSQWLYYREVDQQLQALLEALERELAQLQERTQIIEQYGESGQAQEACLQDDNKLILALHSLHRLPNNQNGQISPVASTPIPASRMNETPSEPGESISSALFAWSSLPNFGPQEVPTGTPEAPVGNDLPFTPFDRPLPPIPHSEMALLPEDMGSFIDEHTMTDPQIELPWWFRNIAAASHATNSPFSPIDQESIRTNRLVQRWLERWRRQSAHARQQQSGEKPS